MIDDIRPLREISQTPDIHDAKVHVFRPPQALAVNTAEAIVAVLPIGVDKNTSDVRTVADVAYESAD